MGTIVDDNEEAASEIIEAGDVQDSTAFAETTESYSTEEPQSLTEDEVVPEKYKGKSANDIARMHQEAEKLIGRQGAEVGELRRIVDDFIKTQKIITIVAQRHRLKKLTTSLILRKQYKVRLILTLLYCKRRKRQMQ